MFNNNSCTNIQINMKMRSDINRNGSGTLTIIINDTIAFIKYS